MDHISIASDGNAESDTDSLLDDILGSAMDKMLFEDPDGCTIEETIELRHALHKQGKDTFKTDAETLKFSNLKLCTAFGIPSMLLQDLSSAKVLSVLDRAIDNELRVRSKLLSFNTFEDIVNALLHAKNIVVLSGAGISTSLGIPDFRTEGSGLYSQLAHLGLSDPQEVFSLSLFKEDPSIFYSIAQYVYPPSIGKFTPTHAFIRLLQDKNKLLRNYSQNIDNVEAAAGIFRENLVQCHGSFHQATCLKCGAQVPGSSLAAIIRASKVPRCSACPSRPVSPIKKKKRKRPATAKPSKLRKREDWWDSNSDDDDEGAYTIEEPGVLKPDITFFDERLPDRYFQSLSEDRRQADLILVIGTSLQVDPVNTDIVNGFPRHVPQVYINLQPVKDFDLDVQLLGRCDVVVAELCRRAGWELKHDSFSDSQKVDVEAVSGQSSHFRVQRRPDTT